MPLRGVIENMSWFTGDDGKRYELFGRGGGEALAADLGVPLLAQLPFVPALREGGDVGRPVVADRPDQRGGPGVRGAGQDDRGPGGDSGVPPGAYDSLTRRRLAPVGRQTAGVGKRCLSCAPVGTPIGRRVVLGMLGLGAVGIVAGSRVQDALNKVLAPLEAADPTGLTQLIPAAGGFRIYSVTGSLPSGERGRLPPHHRRHGRPPDDLHPGRPAAPCPRPCWSRTSNA